MNTVESDSLWERIAPSCFRLRNGVVFHRHEYRGQTWYLLEDSSAGRQYRINTALYRILMRFDGGLTLSDIWEQAAGEAVSREDLLRTLAQLQAGDLLVSNRPMAASVLMARWKRQQRQRVMGRWMRPLAPRFPLLDPDAFLGSTLHLVRPLFSLPALLIWLLIVTCGVLAAAMNGDGLVEYGASRFSDPKNLLLLCFIYPLVKSLHELGHGYATKVWGGQVHEMGIMLLVLVPIPYVEASAAGAFPQKYRRVVVGAAGIMVEAVLAALAVIAWLNLNPGMLKDLAYDVFVVAGVSTLLFNGNPLLRFDGYYVLSDAVEIPNLASRSNRYYGYLVKRYLFGMQDVLSPVTAAGERAWFLFYGVASMAYRLFISLMIAFYLAGTYLLLGVVLAVWALAVQFIYPLVRSIGFVVLSPVLRGRRLRAVTVVLSLSAVALGSLYLVRVPQSTWAEAVIRPSETAIVRAEVDGFVAELMRRHGDFVKPGEPLLRLEDDELSTRIAVLRGKLREIEANLDSERLADRVQVEIYRERLTKLRAELDQAMEEQGRLTLVSPGRGRLELPRDGDLPDRFVRKGEVLGYVANTSDVTARVVVPQSAMDRMLTHADNITVHLPGSGGQSFSANSLEAVPSATAYLPSAALGSMAGGAIPVDARDEQGLRAIERVFQFDVTLPYQNALRFVGRRVYVRFEHGKDALASRIYQRIRRQFLSRLGI